MLELECPPELRAATRAALAARGIDDGHVTIQLVDEARIRELNLAHRGIDAPTDVLSFPVDGPGPTAGPRELGDVVICPAHTADLEEAAVHGVLHLVGMDHETDGGEMLAEEARIMRELKSRASAVGAKHRTLGGAKPLDVP
jgi:probable rRNA maturation factor